MVPFIYGTFRLPVKQQFELFELGQVRADHAFEAAAHGDRVHFRNIGETKQQAALAPISDHATGKSIDGKASGLSLARQIGIAHTAAHPRDQMHAAWLQIDGEALAKHRRQSLN